MSERIAVGVIRKAHGVRGEASVEPWTDDVERFDDLETVTLVAPDEAQTREVTVESVRIHAGRALLKFSGIETPEDVQTLHNWTVEIPEDEARELEEDEYFLHDLVGLTLIDAEGRERGDQGTVIELEVAPADLGKVIGRQGRTARAIRVLLSAAGQKTRRRYSLDIVD